MQDIKQIHNDKNVRCLKKGVAVVEDYPIPEKSNTVSVVTAVMI